MNKKLQIKRNPLLIPLILTLILFAFLGGFSLNKNQETQFKALQSQTTPSPAPTGSATNISEYKPTTKPSNTRAVVIPISNKTVYCIDTGYDAVNKAIQDLREVINTGDSLLAEQDRCNNSCRDKMNEIIASCKSSSDEEACLKSCPNNCLKLVESRLKDVQSQVKEKAGVVNKIAAQFCTN